MNKGIKIFLGIILCVWLVGTIFSIGFHKPITDELDNNPDFQYTTSLTSNYDRSDKAKVYISSMSVQETAQYFINKNRPDDYTDLTNNEAVQLTYDDHYVLIYSGEDEKTYVQVSSRKYVHNNGFYGLYRPYRNNIILFYNNSYTSGRYYSKDNQRYGSGYSNQVNNLNNSGNATSNNSDTKIKTDKDASSKIRTKSVRSESVGTKSRLGGGTSFGK